MPSWSRETRTTLQQNSTEDKGGTNFTKKSGLLFWLLSLWAACLRLWTCRSLAAERPAGPNGIISVNFPTRRVLDALSLGFARDLLDFLVYREIEPENGNFVQSVSFGPFQPQKLRQGAGTPTPAYGCFSKILFQGVLGPGKQTRRSGHRPWSALWVDISVLQRQLLSKSRLRKLASSNPSLAFKLRWETRSPLTVSVSMKRTAALRCTLKRSQGGCALRISLAVEESLHLAQALSQGGILLTETAGWSLRGVLEWLVWEMWLWGPRNHVKKPACRFLLKKFSSLAKPLPWPEQYSRKFLVKNSRV